MLPGMCRFYLSGSQSRIPSQRRRFDRRRLQKTRTRKKLSPNESQIHQKRQMCRLQMIERKSRQYIRLVDWCVLQLRLKTSQIDQLQLLASLLHKLCVCEMLTSSYTITTKCNGRLKAAHAMIDDNRYDIVGCCAAGQLGTGPLRSAMVRRYSIGCTRAVRLLRVKVLLYYCHQV